MKTNVTMAWRILIAVKLLIYRDRYTRKKR